MLRRLFPGVVAMAVLLLVPAGASAHAALDSASPGPDDVVSGTPEAVVAHFTQNLHPERSTIAIYQGTERLARGGYDDTAANQRTMRVELPALAPGEYEVRWVTLSTEDDEIERGTYTFTVIALTPSPSASPTTSATTTSPPSSASPAPSSSPSGTPTPSPSPSPAASADAGQMVVPIVVALIVVAGIGVWVLRRQGAR